MNGLIIKNAICAMTLILGSSCTDKFVLRDEWHDSASNSVRIWTRRPWDATAMGYFYEIVQTGKVIQSMAFFYADPHDGIQFTFQVATNVDEPIVAAAFRDKPTELLVIHDFKNNVCWPRDYDWQITNSYGIGSNLTEQMNSLLKSEGLKLGRY